MLDLQRYAEKKKEIDRIHHVLKIKKTKQWYPPNGCSETCLYILPMLGSVQCTYTVCTLYSTYSDYEA